MVASVLGGALLIQIGCQKKTEFLFVSPAVENVAYEATIKELLGNNLLDILFIIDNSGSMTKHQANVITNVNNFASVLNQNAALKWRIGLISTDENDFPYVGMTAGDLVESSDPKAVDRFKEAVAMLGTAGSATEKTFGPVLKALGNNPNFLRKNAELALILVSDAPEQTNMTVDDFLTNLQKFHPIDHTLFYGMLNPQDWCVPTDDAFVWAGNKFDLLLQKVRGKAFKLCDPNFGANLNNIGDDLLKQVSSPRLILPKRPKLETLKVYYLGKIVPSGSPEQGGLWQYEEVDNALVFSSLEFAPSDLAKVRIEFEAENGFK